MGSFSDWSVHHTRNLGYFESLTLRYIKAILGRSLVVESGVLAVEIGFVHLGQDSLTLHYLLG